MRRNEEIRKIFISLLWLHFDLNLPPLSPHPNRVPSHLMPLPKSGAIHAAHEEALGNFLIINQPEDDVADEMQLKGGLDFEPVEGLIDWAKDVERLVSVL
jgi:hypothetical protein